MKKNNKILYIGNKTTKKTKSPTTLEDLANHLESENYTVYSSSEKLNKILRLLDMCFSVFQYRKKVDYILIDTYSTANFYYTFFTSQIARFFRIKYIPILHGGNLPSRLDRSKLMSNLIFKNSYKNIAPSGYLKHEFDKRGYKTELIPNVININDYEYKERILIEPKLLYVRAFSEIYNPIMAINVIKQLTLKYPNAKLCMVGPVKDKSFSEVTKLVDELNLESHIEFTGYLSKKEWHKKSNDYDIFINTTNVDNTPVSVIEAMALGLPVVSTNVGGIPFLITHKIDGLLIEKSNVNEMVDAIISLIKGEHQFIALKARSKVENFSWSVVKHKWIKILE